METRRSDEKGRQSATKGGGKTPRAQSPVSDEGRGEDATRTVDKKGEQEQEQQQQQEQPQQTITITITIRAEQAQAKQQQQKA